MWSGLVVTLGISDPAFFFARVLDGLWLATFVSGEITTTQCVDFKNKTMCTCSGFKGEKAVPFIRGDTVKYFAPPGARCTSFRFTVESA
jgi:hypothetical protein